MTKNLFQSREIPKIYAYSDKNPSHKDLLKIGYTTRDVKERIKEQYVKMPEENYTKIEFEEIATTNNGEFFTDKLVHKKLEENGIERINGEWFRCDVDTLKSIVISIKENKVFDKFRKNNFKMRPEQERAVEQTYQYFTKLISEKKTPHFLWNAKMRFGKTFAAYQLAKRMGWKRLLIMTFKPAVQDSWEKDLNDHIDFDGWQFVANKDKETLKKLNSFDKGGHIVCFGSFQDFLGRNENGGIKLKNEWVHTINWDCVIFDEYHYGAWRDKSKDMFEKSNEEDKNEYKEYIESIKGTGQDYFNEDYLPITTKAYLYLSGTPFRALESGEFIEEQIFNWTYSDEQKAKEEWNGDNNPYSPLPQMVMMTYQLPEEIEKVAKDGEFNFFNLNTFFETIGDKEDAVFKYENEVQRWLNFIRGADKENLITNLKSKSVFPFNDVRLLEFLTHTLWFMPDVNSCYAMKNLLEQKQNVFYHDYKIILAAGKDAGIGVEALKKLNKEIGDPLKTKSITLTCGKLTTGVSVPAWSGIFMLRNLSSPETYFQSAFRIQTPWVVKDEENNKHIMKEFCYIFDFAPNRALRQIADYSVKLNIDANTSQEKKIEDFIDFLPVLAYDNGILTEINAGGIIDKIISGTTATLLARKWQTALLVNVDNNTLEKLLNNEKAKNALMSIEYFRNLNTEIETIINKASSIKDKKTKDRELTKEEKKELTEEEKEYKSLRKQIQEKLIKLATRIPIFMYLTDYREESLRDVITKLEPNLFKKVTGLEIEDFELLVSLNVFNSTLMNDAIFNFKRYEDSSLEYSGINLHLNDKRIGLFDTVITNEDYEILKK